MSVVDFQSPQVVTFYKWLSAYVPMCIYMCGLCMDAVLKTGFIERIPVYCVYMYTYSHMHCYDIMSCICMDVMSPGQLSCKSLYNVFIYIYMY